MLNYSRLGRVIAVIALFTCLLAADDASKPLEHPHSPKAKAAIEKHRTTAEKLRTEYYTKLVATDEQCVKDLEASMKIAATNGGDAAEIDRISEARKSAVAELQSHRDELQPVPRCTLWSETYNGVTGKFWLKSDGTCVGDTGLRGKWERQGNAYTVYWSNNTDHWTVSDDGQSFVGASESGIRVTGKLLGSNTGGAPPPPK